MSFRAGDDPVRRIWELEQEVAGLRKLYTFQLNAAFDRIAELEALVAKVPPTYFDAE